MCIAMYEHLPVYFKEAVRGRHSEHAHTGHTAAGGGRITATLRLFSAHGLNSHFEIEANKSHIVIVVIHS